MVIGLMIISSIPTVTGVAEAFSAQKTKDQREKDARRMEKFRIDIRCEQSDGISKDIHGGRIVLKDEKVWIGPPGVVLEGEYGYVAEAFYIEYPDPARKPPVLGLVSQVRDDPPLLNWIYIDKGTMELKYGNRTASIEHHIGPWDWSEDEVQVVFDHADASYINAFYAVETTQSKWQLYFDLEGDQLKDFVSEEVRKQQIRLYRTKAPVPQSTDNK